MVAECRRQDRFYIYPHEKPRLPTALQLAVERTQSRSFPMAAADSHVVLCDSTTAY
jgi:hypothetical protein